MSDLDLDLDLVRAEIKAWERNFAATHNRDPSVKDIREDPTINKYKRYKKLIRPKNNVTPTKNKHHLPSTALSRARKRLCGEPVSPSPSKPKRQRVRDPKSDRATSSSEHELDQEPQCSFTSSFVADSPVKAPAGGKSFKLLFDDALPALPIPRQHPSSSAQRDPSDIRFLHKVSADLDLQHDTESSNPTSAPGHRVVQGKTSPNTFPPSSDSKRVVSEVSQPRTSMKRALDASDIIPDSTQATFSLQSQYPLIPPSPPPHEPTNRDIGKGKVKAAASRKKFKIEDEESDEGADNFTLKIATVRPNRGVHAHRHADDLVWDPSLHLGTATHDPASVDQTDHASGAFSVDLPDKFRRVVSISPSRSQSGMEERVVRRLLYGDRVGHYHPSRGGDIWDAGETHEGAHGDADTEDDWEDEPVPWDVGEM